MNKNQQATYRPNNFGVLTIVLSFILIAFALNGCKSTSGNSYTQSDTSDNEGLIPLSSMLAKPRKAETGNRSVPISADGATDSLREAFRQTALTGAKRLPTLREQMTDVSEAQQHILSATDSVLSQLNEIRLDIEVIKNTLDNTPLESPKSKIKELNKPKKSTTLKSETESDIILPDEKVSKSKKEFKSTKSPSVSSKNIEEKQVTAPKVAKTDEQQEKSDNNKKSFSDSLNSSNYKTALRLISRREYAQSIPYLQAAIEKPDNITTKVNSQYWLGESYFATGKYDEAASQFKSVLAQKNSAKLDDAMVMLGETYFRQGKKEEAKKIFTSLISTFPTSEFIPRARKRLQQL
ncbi:MAG: tetratricopeptide repeat protein [Ignavibacteria bacterium]|jgi:TolA-binding protein|nr:tetratricopeptide repeat protein [Ignavibacteria bacterium]